MRRKPNTEELADLTIRPSAAANVYVTRWPKHWGWAVIIVDDATGMLAITSDHGDWAHAWPVPGKHSLGHGCASLHHFLAGADAEYAAGKCIPRARAQEVCFARTKEQLIRETLETRRCGLSTKQEARKRYDELVLWSESDHDCVSWAWPRWVRDHGDAVMYRDTSEWIAFCEIVWPVVQRCVREEIARRERVPAEHRRFGT